MSVATQLTSRDKFNIDNGAWGVQHYERDMTGATWLAQRDRCDMTGATPLVFCDKCNVTDVTSPAQHGS